MKADYMFRLAYIKYIYYEGTKYLKNPEPFCSPALLFFHDAIELLMNLICWKNKKKCKKNNFEEYFRELGYYDLYQQNLYNLTTTRNRLKHSGVFPSKVEMKSIHQGVRNVLNELLQKEFNTTLDNIFLADLVQHETAKQSLKKAEELLRQGNTKDAIYYTNHAFTVLMGWFLHKLNQYSKHFKKYGLPVGPDQSELLQENLEFTRMLLKILDELNIQQQRNRVIKLLCDAVDSLQKNMLLILVGIDMSEYLKYHLIAPPRDITMYGIAKPMYTPTEEEVCFCINFVVKTALKLQEIHDYIFGE